MGRILFLSAVALVAYRYIVRSNLRHQPLNSGKGNVEILPPTTPAPRAAVSEARPAATEARPQQQLVGAASSRAVEPEPHR
jgi:hypothetical protein